MLTSLEFDARSISVEKTVLGVTYQSLDGIYPAALKKVLFLSSWYTSVWYPFNDAASVAYRSPYTLHRYNVMAHVSHVVADGGTESLTGKPRNQSDVDGSEHRMGTSAFCWGNYSGLNGRLTS